jgi:mycothiol synthase
VARLPDDADPIDVEVSAGNDEALRFAERRGLRPSYLSLSMAADVDAVPPPGDPPPAERIRTFRPGDEEPLRRVHNEAFAETPRFREITEEAMEHYVSTPYFDPAGVQLVEAVGGALVGYVWCDAVREKWEARGERTGYIEVLGVHPAGRRAGLGEHLLRRAVAWLRTAGCDVAELDVWLENANALRLYERNGFRVVARHQWLSAPLSAVRSATMEVRR